MKEIKIKAIINNSENETYSLDTIAEYDKKNNTIIYQEENIQVKLILLKDKCFLNRFGDDYNIDFEFQKNKTTKCIHKVISLGLIIEMDVKTLKLEIKEKYVYIQYKIINEGTEIGTFEYKLMIL